MLANSLRDLGAGVVWIDHMAQILGLIDENSSGVAKIMSALRWLAEDLNISVNLIHHSVKNAGRFGISASDSLRGHGSLLANSDIVAKIERQVTDPLAVTFTPVALRGADIQPFSAKFSYKHKDDGSNELEQARFFGVEPVSLDAEIERAAVEMLEEEPFSNQTTLRAAIAERVPGAGDPLIRSMLSRLERDGRVLVKKGAQNSKLYSLPGGEDD